MNDQLLTLFSKQFSFPKESETYTNMTKKLPNTLGMSSIILSLTAS